MTHMLPETQIYWPVAPQVETLQFGKGQTIMFALIRMHSKFIVCSTAPVENAASLDQLIHALVTGDREQMSKKLGLMFVAHRGQFLMRSEVANLGISVRMSSQTIRATTDAMAAALMRARIGTALAGTGAATSSMPAETATAPTPEVAVEHVPVQSSTCAAPMGTSAPKSPGLSLMPDATIESALAEAEAACSRLASRLDELEKPPRVAAPPKKESVDDDNESDGEPTIGASVDLATLLNMCEASAREAGTAASKAITAELIANMAQWPRLTLDAMTKVHSDVLDKLCEKTRGPALHDGNPASTFASDQATTRSRNWHDTIARLEEKIETQAGVIAYHGELLRKLARVLDPSLATSDRIHTPTVKPLTPSDL